MQALGAAARMHIEVPQVASRRHPFNMDLRGEMSNRPPSPDRCAANAGESALRTPNVMRGPMLVNLRSPMTGPGAYGSASRV